MPNGTGPTLASPADGAALSPQAAIAADPDLGQAWRTLGKALGRYGTAEELAQLRADHQARFGRAL